MARVVLVLSILFALVGLVLMFNAGRIEFYTALAGDLDVQANAARQGNVIVQGAALFVAGWIGICLALRR
jgi:hypothetical protein